MSGSLTALDVVQVVASAVGAIAQMVARGCSKDQMMERIKRLDEDVAQVDEDMDATLDGGKPT